MASFSRFNSSRCYIIAEIGGNFTTWEEAKRLIDQSAICGVDAVKLQTYRADTLSAKSALFDMENTGITSQHALFEKYEIDEALHRRIFEYAELNQLDWFSTPSHESDVEMLERLGVGAYKIGSDDAVNIPFLRYVARKRKPIFLSTGMSTLEEIRESVAAIQEEGNESLMLLHAITSYPTHPEHVNLAAMQTLAAEFRHLPVGYSDHTLTPIAALCAVAMGARIIERHFTWNKEAVGPDHRLSSDPAEMTWLVESIRAFESMRGDGVKRPAESERKTRLNNRKSIVLNRSVQSGQVLQLGDLAIKRPGTGIAPKYLPQLLGRRVNSELAEDELLRWEHLV